MVTVPAPPVAPKDEGLLLAVTWHLSDVGATIEVDEDVQWAKRNAQPAAKAVQR